MASVSAQEYQIVFSELQGLQEKFVALEQENQRLLGDLQQISLEKQQTQQQHGELQKPHGELALRVQQLEATIVALQQQGSSPQGFHKEPKIRLPVKFDGTLSRCYARALRRAGPRGSWTWKRWRQDIDPLWPDYVGHGRT